MNVLTIIIMFCSTQIRAQHCVQERSYFSWLPLGVFLLPNGVQFCRFVSVSHGRESPYSSKCLHYFGSAGCAPKTRHCSVFVWVLSFFKTFTTLERVELFLLDNDCDAPVSSSQKWNPSFSKDLTGISETQLNEYQFSAVKPTFLTNYVCNKGKAFLCLNIVKPRPRDYSFNLSLCISDCQTIGITGPVGCWKSSLFYSIFCMIRLALLTQKCRVKFFRGVSVALCPIGSDCLLPIELVF